MNKAYHEYLKSKRWEQKRLQVFMKQGRKCKACGTRKGPLQVHHLSYDNFGKEPLSDLMVLCWRCHNRVTSYHRRNRRKGLRQNTFTVIKIIKAEILKGKTSTL